MPNSSFSLAQNRIPKSGANATRRPAVPPLFAHFPGAAASGADEKKRKRGNAEGRGGDGLSPVVIHRRLRLASIDGRTDGHGRDTEDGFTQTRVTNNRSVRPYVLSSSSSSSFSFRLVSTQLLLRPRRNVRLAELAGSSLAHSFIRSFVPFCSVPCFSDRSKKKIDERDGREGTVGSRGALGGLQTSRIRQIQLTRTELNRRNPSAGFPLALPTPFSSDPFCGSVE